MHDELLKQKVFWRIDFRRFCVPVELEWHSLPSLFVQVDGRGSGEVGSRDAANRERHCDILAKDLGRYFLGQAKDEPRRAWAEPEQ